MEFLPKYGIFFELIEIIKGITNNPELDSKLNEYLGSKRLMDNEVKRLPLPTLEGLTIVDVEDIIYIKAEGNYSVFYFKNNLKIMVSKNMSVYEEKIKNRQFVRIHKSYIINILFVSKYYKGRGGYVLLKNGDALNVSVNRKKEFLERLFNY